jgi:hypothetical protein
MDFLDKVSEDQLKNHRIKKLRVEVRWNVDIIDSMARYCRLVPAITSLHFPPVELAVEGIELLINNLKYLKELVIYDDKITQNVDRKLNVFRRLRIENLERLVVQKKGIVKSHLSADDLEVFVKNHPKIREMEVQSDEFNQDTVNLIVKNL